MAELRTPAEERYWIVQPLIESPGWEHPTPLEGFGRYFHNFPPMGRSEYEHPGESLKELYDQAGGAPVIKAYQITAEGTSRPVYFVGPEPGRDPLSPFRLANCPDDMQLWLGAGGGTKVPCGFAEYFHGATPQVEGFGPIVGWWAMASKFMFALDPTVAERLLKAIRLEATTHTTFRYGLGWD
jgi:hypothetical protein